MQEITILVIGISFRIKEYSNVLLYIGAYYLAFVYYIYKITNIMIIVQSSIALGSIITYDEIPHYGVKVSIICEDVPCTYNINNIKISAVRYVICGQTSVENTANTTLGYGNIMNPT